MSILKVARLGHPVLRKPAAAVSSREIQSSNTRQLIDDMIETMRDADGAGPRSVCAPSPHDPQAVAPAPAYVGTRKVVTRREGS